MNICKMLRVAFLTILLVACTINTMVSAKVIVWFDKNGNGLFDNGETPLPGVFTYSSWGTYHMTGDHGEANFNDLNADDFWKNNTISVKTPDGFTPTTPTHLALTAYSGTYQFGFKLIDSSKSIVNP